MKKIGTAIFAAAIVLAALMGAVGPWSSSPASDAYHPDSLFERAVAIIKKYETLHKPRHWPLVGYGHKVLPGEKYSRTRTLSEVEADALLRKDLLKNCAVFRNYGPDSLLLGVLAYNIGSGAVKKSSVAKKLLAGDRDIYENYVSHCRYRGKVHSQIRSRRIEEFESLFLPDSVIQAMNRRPSAPAGLWPFTVGPADPTANPFLLTTQQTWN